MNPTKKINEFEYYELINYYLGISKESLIKKPELLNKANSSEKLAEAIKKIESGTPLQYVTKQANFFGNNFYVNKNVLIPRPETEILVQEALKFINKNRVESIIDIGTGSGCIIISLCRIIKNDDIRLIGSDVSDEALRIAVKNAKALGCNKIKFVKSDLLKNIDEGCQFDLILANLPYLKNNYLADCEDKESLSREPRLALAAGKDGLSYIKRLIRSSKSQLSKTGLMILEIDPSQKQSITTLCRENNISLSFKKDLNNRTRLALIRR